MDHAEFYGIDQKVFKMKIVTWNINGIRAASKDISLKKLLDSLNADVICLQETKITRDMLDTSTAIVDGYHAFFSFSKVRGGYSGVATYCKSPCTPIAAEEGLTGLLIDANSSTSIKCNDMDLHEFTMQDLTDLDAEGRALLTEHEVTGDKSVVIVNVYCPRAERDNKERWGYKQMFYRLLQTRCEHLLMCEKNVIIVGDMNVSHTKLDHCDPDCDPEWFESNDSRIWMSQFLLGLSKDNSEAASRDENDSLSQERITKDIDHTRAFSSMVNISSTEALEDYTDCMTASPPSFSHFPSNLSANSTAGKKRKYFVDLFRYFHPTREDAFTCWSTVTGARKTNYGTRIDYIISNEEFRVKYAVNCDIRPDIQGSDHCPVEAVFDCDIIPSKNLPDICSSLMPEFKGKQQSIKMFMTSQQKPRTTDIANTVTSMPLNRNSSNYSSFNLNVRSKLSGVKRKADDQTSANRAKITKKSRNLASSAQNNTSSSFKSYFGIKSSKINQTLSDNMKEKIDVPSQSAASADEVTLKDFQETERKQSVAEEDSACRNCGDSRVGNTETKQPTCAESGKLTMHQQMQTEIASGDKNLIDKEKVNRLHWKTILKGPEPPPRCKGHDEECVLRTVKKKGPNIGRHFYCCARPEGKVSDKEARCSTFIWKKR